MITPRLLFLLCLCPALSAATDLTLTAKSGGQSSVVVTPGSTVSYSIVGELSDSGSQGLAMVTFDLAFNGGPLAQASAPSTDPMQHFATPLGLSNPAGFGGTVSAGHLIQVGGAQNTINNVFAAAPVGNVLLGVAQHGAPQVLATGTVTAPAAVGTYTLSISNVMANVVRLGETGSPFWAVDPAGSSNANLTVQVSALFADVPTLSVATTGTQHLTLDAGPGNANRIFILLGTMAGTTPGLTLPNGTHIPLNPSAYFSFTLANPNVLPLTHSLGFLDANGHTTSSFTLPHVPPVAAGLVLHHAYVLLQPVNFASNAVEVTLVP